MKHSRLILLLVEMKMHEEINGELKNALMSLNPGKAMDDLEKYPEELQTRIKEFYAEKKDKFDPLKAVLAKIEPQKRIGTIYQETLFRAAKHPLSLLTIIESLPIAHRYKAFFSYNRDGIAPFHIMLGKVGELEADGAREWDFEFLCKALNLLPANQRVDALMEEYSQYYRDYNGTIKWDNHVRISIRSMVLLKKLVEEILPKEDRSRYVKYQLNSRLIYHCGGYDGSNIAFLDMLKEIPVPERTPFLKSINEPSFPMWFNHMLKRHSETISAMLELLPPDEVDNLVESAKLKYPDSEEVKNYATFTDVFFKSHPKRSRLEETVLTDPKPVSQFASK